MIPLWIFKAFSMASGFSMNFGSLVRRGAGDKSPRARTISLRAPCSILFRFTMFALPQGVPGDAQAVLQAGPHRRADVLFAEAFSSIRIAARTCSRHG